MENKLEDLDLTTFAKLFDIVIEFAVAYGFQILGAIVVLLIGLKVASWCARKTTSLAEAKGVDVTLSRFIGNVVRLVVVVAVVIVTLGNFGVAIAPLIALVGASAFGVTLAIQGPLSNYGAGLAIILTRPFVVGDTITVQGASGVVEEISLGATILIGEDGERILVPNRQIVGEIIIDRFRQARRQIGNPWRRQFRRTTKARCRPPPMPRRRRSKTVGPLPPWRRTCCGRWAG